MEHALVPVDVVTIPAGKFRRYHGESWLDKLRDVRTNIYNLRDTFYIAAGFCKSLWLLLSNRPDVIFAKGGYVCLPLGLAAAALRIPIVVHDSDTRPGLTNRVLSHFAKSIATGSPIENYSYDPARTEYVGVPIQETFHRFSDEEKIAARHELGMIDVSAPLVVVTGGGLGSQIINEAIIRSGEALMRSGVHVYHVTGKRHYDKLESRLPDHPHYQAVPFVYRDMQQVLGAADLVVSRASATFIQELAGLAKPAILIPASHLSDQVKNATVYERADAAVVLSDHDVSEGDRLGQEIVSLLSSRADLSKLSHNLHQFARPDAALRVASMINDVYQGTAA
jgi:UDP-N-acetylglucosamine--N-acetylmuramyl-(pentapeptide) pyrophosphoryl-undecaprenol N-acetylglucosamine transferase